MNCALIVTGSQRGQVWLVAGEGALPRDPQADSWSGMNAGWMIAPQSTTWPA